MGAEKLRPLLPRLCSRCRASCGEKGRYRILPHLFLLNLFIIVFGGGGRRGGCSGPGCLFWLLISLALSVGLTVLVNLIALLLSSPVPGIPGVDI